MLARNSIMTGRFRIRLGLLLGDLVLAVNERKIVGESKSFRNRLVGPYRITSCFNDVNFVISDLEGKKKQTIHYNRLRPYISRSRGSPEASGVNLAGRADEEGSFQVNNLNVLGLCGFSIETGSGVGKSRKT
jgi:hypothetical protein